MVVVVFALPPHASIPLPRATRSSTIPNMVCHLRRRPGMPRSTRHARVAPPVAYHGIPGRLGASMLALVAAVVVIVRVAVTGEAPVMLTEPVEPKLTVGGYVVPVELATVAVRAMLPV